MTFFPATAETYVVEVNPQSSQGYICIPVMGWVIENNRPLPLTLNGKHTLAGACGVLFPGGMVEDIVASVAFDTVEAWLDSNPGSSRKSQAPAKTKTPTPAQEPDDGSAYEIEWTTSTFKNNSFWHYDDGEHEFVFQIDGENELPKATKKVVKIKRDEFMAMKKNIDALTVEEIMAAEPLDVEEPDDDDGMDML